MDLSKEFEHYMAHLAKGLGRADRHAGLSGYCTGQPHAGELGADQLRQLGSPFICQNNLGGNSHSPSP